MQLAARRVAWENAQLRRLLASNGVSAEQIEGFLRDREQMAVHRLSSDAAGEGIQSSAAARGYGVHRLGSPVEEPRLIDSVQGTNSVESDCGRDVSDQRSAVDADGNKTLPAVSDCFCPAPNGSDLLAADDSVLEMSCETAASIISGMRGNGDREQARSQLGCEGSEQCSVRNVKVLQVMEMD